jgi:pilus assembly protein CpaC
MKLTHFRLSAGPLGGCLLLSLSLGLAMPAAAAAPQHGGSIVYGTIVQAPVAVAAKPVHPPVAPAVALPLPQSTAPVCSGGGLSQQRHIAVSLGKSTTIALPEAVKSRSVGNPGVVQSVLISPKVLYVLGTAIGTTNMLVQGHSGACSVIDVVVGIDPSGLQQAIANLMPEETGVVVKAASGALVLTGTVSDAVKAQRIVELAEQFVASGNQPVATKADGQGKGAAMAATKSRNVINMLRIAAPQQVLLEVKVAEVSKTLIEKLGAKTNLFGGVGNAHFGLTGDFLSNVSGLLSAADGKNALGAEKNDALVKILAEPNLMAISGQKANFLAGGKIFIPVPDGDGKITLQEQTFGVGLVFTPTVLDNGRVNLQVAPEVSELSQNGVSMSFGESRTQWNLPLITTRRASTTIQVFDGQSFAIGGLMKNNISGTIKQLPILGDLPLIGPLFRSVDYQSDKTELVFIVTPHLAKALPKAYPLPTDSFGKVNDSLLLTGDMEGKQPAAVVQPAATLPVPRVLPEPQAVAAKPAAVAKGAPAITPAAVAKTAPLAKPVATAPLPAAVKVERHAVPVAADKGQAAVAASKTPQAQEPHNSVAPAVNPAPSFALPSIKFNAFSAI